MLAARSVLRFFLHLFRQRFPPFGDRNPSGTVLFHKREPRVMSTSEAAEYRLRTDEAIRRLTGATDPAAWNHWRKLAMNILAYPT
jgi:hypothetical protein